MPENKYSLEEVYKSIGKNERLRELIDHFREDVDQDSFVEWWYDSNNKGLGKSPDEVCKEGKQKELEKMLMDILTAAQGG